MTFPTEVLLLAPFLVFAGYVVFGITGFGAAPVIIPVLAHFVPLADAVALCTVLDMTSGVVLAYHTRRHADWGELRWLLPFSLLGVALGVTLLVNLPREASLLALGVFVCAYALYALASRGAGRRLPRYLAPPAGLAGGIFGALFGVGGPPYVMYLTGRIANPAAMRATITAMLIVNVGARLLAFVAAGVLLQAQLWIAAVALLPMAALGLWTGNRLHGRASRQALVRTVATVLLLMGTSLIVRAL
jgi:uncharacterized membrane protein YfcA